MLGPATTAGLIDEYESRFTTAYGAHFLIGTGGDESWPISEQESTAFRDRYRRRMLRARLIRRGSLILFPVMLVFGWQLPREPRWFSDAFATLTAITLFAAPFLGFIQHKLTSDLTQEGIERQLERRIAIRDDPAITPSATRLARVVRQMLILVGAILLAIEIGHFIGPRDEFAGHLRVLTGLTVGNESLLARFTGTLSRILYVASLFGAVLLWLDRDKRQRAGKSPPVEALPEAEQVSAPKAEGDGGGLADEVS
jgi:hypothetical protein